MEFRAMRRFKQQLSKDECVEILKSAPRGVIAMNGALQGLKVDLLEKDNKVCFTTTDEGHIEEGDWANTFKSVVCLGHVEEVNDVEKIYDRLRRLAKGFYPSEESIEKEIEKAGSRVKMYVINIDHMTGKLVHEK